MKIQFFCCKPVENERGFALVLALVALILLTLFGVWALQTSDFENRVAGNAQEAERHFNLSEGANSKEVTNLGYGIRPWLKLPNPNATDSMMLPPNDSQFDPGNQTANTLAGVRQDDERTWPWGNLEDKYDASADHRLDYRYLFTYLYADAPPMGFSADLFSSYKFRVQGNMARQPTVIETGGLKIGMLISL